MPSWDEWKNLKPEQREYSLYKTLNSIDNTLITDKVETDKRIINCGKRFKIVENRKRIDIITCFLGGVLGGILAILGKALMIK